MKTENDQPAAAPQAAAPTAKPRPFEDKVATNRMIWRRENFKWLLGALLFLFVLFVLGVYLAVIKPRRDPLRLTRLGDAALARQDVRAALPLYGRALRYSRQAPQKVKVLEKLIAAYMQLRTDNPYDASLAFKSVLGLHEEVLALDPTRRDVADRLLADYFQVATDLGSPEYWKKLQTRADAMLTLDPQNPVARKYRGIATTADMTRGVVGELLRNRARQDLEQALKANPADADACFYLAVWQLQAARLARNEPLEAAKADELLAGAVATVKGFAGRQPANVRGRLNFLRVSMEAGAAAKRKEWSQAALDSATALEKELLAGDDPQATRELAVFLMNADRQPLKLENGQGTTSGIERALALLKGVVAKHPDLWIANYEQALLYRMTGRLDEAIAHYAKASAPQAIRVSAAILKEYNLHLMAKFEWVSTLLQKHEGLHDPRDPLAVELLAEAERRFAEFRGLAEASPAVEIIQGRIEFARGKYWRALATLEAADTRMDRKNALASLLMGKALARLGQWNAALAKLEHALNREEATKDLRVQAAKEVVPILLRIQRFNEAFLLAQALHRANPNEAETNLLFARTLLAVMRTGIPIFGEDKNKHFLYAIQLVKPLAEQGRLEAGRLYAEMMMMAGDRATAREALVRLAAAHPGQREVLRDLLYLEQSLGLTDAFRQRLAAAAQTLPDSPAAALLRGLMAKPEGPLAARLPDLLACAGEPEPFLREFRLAQLLRQAGLKEAAAAALARARQLKPAAPELLAGEFADAFDSGDLVAAGKAIQRAEAAGGFDTADLLLWRGRLWLAQDRLGEAIAQLTALTRERPAFSEGWAALGSAQARAGSVSLAENQFRKALDLKQDNLLAIQGLFTLYDSLKQHDKALAVLRQALMADPFNAGLQRMYADYISRYGDPMEARRVREAIRSSDPGDVENLRRLAELYLQTGLREDARRLLERLLKDEPESIDNRYAMAMYWVAAGNRDTGRKQIEEYVQERERQGKADWRDELGFARFLRHTGAEAEAITWYEKARIHEPAGVADATVEYAGWLHARREEEKALALYRQAVERTGNAALWQPIVEIQTRHRQFEEADQALRAWRQAATGSEAVLLQTVAAAILAQERGDRENARALIGEAIRHDPNRAQLYWLRSRILASAGDLAFEEQIRSDLEAALRLDPGLIPAREQLVDWLLLRNQIDEALRHLRDLVDRNPKAIPYRVQMAQQYLRTGQHDALERFLAESEQALPGQAVWRQFRGASLRARKRLPEAVTEFQEAYRLQPGPETLLQAAEALADVDNNVGVLKLLAAHPEELKASPLLLAVRARANSGLLRRSQAEQDIQAAIIQAAANGPLLDAVLGQLRRVENATELAKRLDALPGNPPAVRFAAAKLFMGTDSGTALARLEALRADLAGKKEMVPMLTSVQWLLGVTYYQRKEVAKAREAYEALLALQPGYAPALNNLAYLLAKDLQRPREALEMATKAVTQWRPQDGDMAIVLDTLGYTLFLNNRLADAETTLLRSIQMRDLASSRMHLAEVLRSRKRLIEAQMELQRARRMVELAGSQEELASIMELENQVNRELLRMTTRPAPPPVPAPAGKPPPAPAPDKAPAPAPAPAPEHAP
ncbi:MAG: tetratricopeptide repeat protein [Lentisphaeria bacterium]|jgi:tetratricopeptide (TPR) repeat protein